MRILVLSKKFPFPLKEGEPIAITYLSRSLRRVGCEVSLLVLNTSKHYFNPARLPEDYDHFKEIQTVEVDNRITPWGAFKSLFSGKSYILSRFYSDEYARKLAEVLKENEFEVVQLETVYLAHYIPVIRQYSHAIIAMRAHNVEHEIWQRFADNSPFFLKKWYLLLQNKHLRRFELEKLREYDILVAITSRDLEVFRRLGFAGKGVVAPVGIDLDDYPPDFQCFTGKTSLCFIGALDWMPNQEGVLWFLDKVWKLLQKELPGIELHIAGKNTPEWLRKRQTGDVFFHGEVPSAISFVNRHPIMIAPLFSGSGIKIKVLEGMALGRVVITTPVGTEGIPARPGEHLLIAATPEQFYRHIVFCFRNQLFMREVSINARQFIRAHFDNLSIAANLKKDYRELREVT